MRTDDKSDFTNLAMILGTNVANYFTLTKAERENVIARAKVELFKLTFEVSGEQHAQLEMEVNQWIRADMKRLEEFWCEPEKTVRQALRSQLRDAMAAQGLEMARLEGN